MGEEEGEEVMVDSKGRKKKCGEKCMKRRQRKLKKAKKEATPKNSTNAVKGEAAPQKVDMQDIKADVPTLKQAPVEMEDEDEIPEDEEEVTEEPVEMEDEDEEEGEEV